MVLLIETMSERINLLQIRHRSIKLNRHYLVIPLQNVHTSFPVRRYYKDYFMWRQISLETKKVNSKALTLILRLFYISYNS